MGRLTVILLLAVLAVTTTAVLAVDPPSVAWTHTWDLNDGLQGWTLAGNTGARWIGPSEPAGPTLSDGASSGAGAGNFFLPDGGTAELDVTGLNLGTGSNYTTGIPRNGFVFQADVYIPNLSPGTGYNGEPGSAIMNAGIAVLRGDDKGSYIVGDSTRGGFKGGDKTWDGTTHMKGWILEELSTVPKEQWWDRWITLRIDYSYSQAGKYNLWAYVPWDNPGGSAGWQPIFLNGAASPDGVFAKLHLGSYLSTSWTQAQWDNVKLAVAAPEPTSLLALGSGLLGLAAMAVRRRR